MNDLFLAGSSTKEGLQMLVRNALQEDPDAASQENHRASKAAGWISAHRIALTLRDDESVHAKLSSALNLLGSEDGSFQTPNGIFYASHFIESPIAAIFPGIGVPTAETLDALSCAVPILAEWRRRFEQRCVGHHGRRPWSGELISVYSLAMYWLVRNADISVAYNVGHSLGDHAALIASNVVHNTLEPDEIIELLSDIDPTPIFEDNTAEKAVALYGRSLAVLMSELVGASDLHVACVNSPKQIVVAGSRMGIEQLEIRMKTENVICTALPNGRAHHTPMFQDGAKAMEVQYVRWPIREKVASYVSCRASFSMRDGQQLSAADLSAQWTSTVDFAGTIEKLYETGVRKFIDLGPGDLMSSFLRDILRGREYVCVRMLSTTMSGLARGVAEMYVAGIPFDRNFVSSHVAIWERADSRQLIFESEGSIQ